MFMLAPLQNANGPCYARGWSRLVQLAAQPDYEAYRCMIFKFRLEHNALKETRTACWLRSLLVPHKPQKSNRLSLRQLALLRRLL